MDILRISVLGAAGVLLGILLKDRAPEYVSLVTMGIGLVILGLGGREDQLSVPVSGETETESSD